MIAQAQTIVTNTIICGLCGGAGHITSDCKVKKEHSANGTVTGVTDSGEKIVTWSEREKMDDEYMSLMAELGQGQAPKPGQGGKCKFIYF